MLLVLLNLCSFFGDSLALTIASASAWFGSGAFNGDKLAVFIRFFYVILG